MKLALDIADAVASELTSALNVPAQRHLLPEYDLAALKTAAVAVVPKSVEIAAFSRAAMRYDAAVDIGIQQKVTGELDAQAAAFADLVDQAIAALTRRPLAALPRAQFVSLANQPIYAPEILAEKRVLLSIITVRYALMETIG